jgi:hypothetical protein
MKNSAKNLPRVKKLLTVGEIVNIEGIGGNRRNYFRSVSG